MVALCSNHPLILGEGNSNLPRIVAIIADALDCGVLEDETKGIRGMMTSILRHIQVANGQTDRQTDITV